MSSLLKRDAVYQKGTIKDGFRIEPRIANRERKMEDGQSFLFHAIGYSR